VAPPRRLQGLLGIGHAQLGRRHHGRFRGLRDRDIGRLSLQRRFGLRQVGFRLPQRGLVIARVNIRQRLSRFHAAIVFGVDGDHGSADAAADFVDVSIDLRVIGAFVALQVIPEQHRGDRQHNESDHNSQDRQRMRSRPGRHALPQRRQGMALGMFAMGVVVAPVIGPALAGYLTDTISLRCLREMTRPC